MPHDVSTQILKDPIIKWVQIPHPFCRVLSSDPSHPEKNQNDRSKPSTADNVSRRLVPRPASRTRLGRGRKNRWDLSASPKESQFIPMFEVLVGKNAPFFSRFLSAPCAKKTSKNHCMFFSVFDCLDRLFVRLLTSGTCSRAWHWSYRLASTKLVPSSMWFISPAIWCHNMLHVLLRSYPYSNVWGKYRFQHPSCMFVGNCAFLCSFFSNTLDGSRTVPFWHIHRCVQINTRTFKFSYIYWPAFSLNVNIIIYNII